MITRLNTKDFERKMLNITQYSLGFIDGVNRGKTVFLNNLGKDIIHALYMYIDSNAKMNTQALHHVYEWYRVGSPTARLFDLDYTVSNLGLSIKSTLRQSNSTPKNSSEPFYNKAKIMENGIPVKISPKRSNVLVFEADGETVFTKKDIVVKNPGGENTKGSFEKVFDTFFSQYFSQSFLRASGILDYIKKPTVYKKNISSGARGGKSVGVKTGYTWIVNAKIGVENG